MTPREMAKVLSGDREGKVALLNSFFERIAQGESIPDDEIPILETLKNELIVEREVVSLSASLLGNSGAKG